MVRKVSLILLAVAVLAASAVFMQARDGQAAGITFDAASACTSGNNSSFTWSHTTGSGNDRFLLVGLSLAPRHNQKVDTVTYAGQPLSLLAFRNNSNESRAEVWRMIAPPPGANDVVVTMTSSRDPVLRGEWLAAGALVVAAGANVASRRELDNAVLERATFVCCDSLEQARLESGDLIEPVAAGVLDWLEVHELHEVVSGGVAGRQSDADVVVFKSNGMAAWDVALGGEALSRARERGVGTTL